MQQTHSPNSVEWVAEQCRDEWHVAFGGLPFPPALWPDRHGLATIDRRSTYFQEAWTAGRNREIGWTWDGATNASAASMHLPPKRIDYVFVGDPYGRDGGAGLVTSCNLAFHERITGRHASDHFGLVVEIDHPERD